MPKDQFPDPLFDLINSIFLFAFDLICGVLCVLIPTLEKTLLHSEFVWTVVAGGGNFIVNIDFDVEFADRPR